MKIEKLQTMDFMGLPGKKAWDFNNKITVLAAPNGAGKTSVISALRYAMTGLEPEGEMIHKGKISAAAQINTAKRSYCRIKRMGKQSRYVMNGKTTSLGELTRALEEEMGSAVTSVKTITSSELLQGLDSQQFGSLILEYLPEMMDKETVISRVSSMTPMMRKIMEENLPGGDFGTNELDAFFAFLVEKRREIKKEILEEESIIRLYGGSEPADVNEDDLRAKLDTLERKRDEAVVYNQKVTAYLQIRDTIERNRTILRQIDEEIAKIRAVRHSEDERKAVEELMLAARKAAHAALDAKKLDRANYNTLKEAVETIRQPVCPLSRNIRCTTDKSSVLDELKEAMNRACESYNRHDRECREATEKALETEEKLKAIETDNNASDRKEQLERQKKQILETTVALPEKPGKGPDLAVISMEIERVRNTLQKLQDHQKVKAAEEKARVKKEELAALEALHSAFSPRGEVKEAITRLYLDEFSGPCNEKAGKLFPGMNIRFVSEGGVSVQVDPKGTGQYVSFRSLSGGERAAVAFLLMLMFATISGTGILILDELSIMDESVLDALLTILTEHEGEYDMAILACVNHTDTMELLGKHGLQITKI